MKSYLLLFFSTLLLLFTLPKPDRNVSGITAVEQSILKKACSSKRQIKRTCPRKCLKHQTHPEQQNAGNVATDCSQQFYAVITEHKPNEFFSSGAPQPVTLSADKIHQTPSLEADPDPPRFS